MTEIFGRRVLVTGASGGLGRALAQELVARGAHVVCVARNEELLQKTCAEIGALPVTADVGDPVASANAVEAAAGALGGIDVLINNAGSMLHSRISERRIDDWRVMLDTNIMSVLGMSAAAVPYLRECGAGDIVNISSGAARRVSAPEYALYSATKAAVNMISAGLRLELAEAGIRVSSVMPGLIAHTNYGHGIRDGALREQVLATKDELGVAPSIVAKQIVDLLVVPHAMSLDELVLMPFREGDTRVPSISILKREG